MRKLVSALLTTTVALTSLAYAAAQTGPTGPPSGGPSAQPAPAAANGLSETELLSYLRTLDPNVKMTKSQDGKATMYQLTLRRGDWQYQIVLVLREGTLDIIAPLGNPIANVQSIPAQALAGLLQASWNFAPAQFSLIKQNDGRMQLVFSFMLSRAGLTTARLGQILNGFCDAVRETYPLWNAVLSASK